MKKLMIAMIAVSGLCSAIWMDVSENDREFARKAADAGLLEVRLGELAQKNGVSADVKKLGEHMVSDHSKANNELKAIASKKGISLPSALGEKNQKKYNELAAKKGADFDQAYSEYMVEDHEMVISMFEKQVKDGNDADLKAFAAKTKPTLDHHLHMSKETRDAVKKTK